jgi:hypothetical protein
MIFNCRSQLRYTPTLTTTRCSSDTFTNYCIQTNEFHPGIALCDFNKLVIGEEEKILLLKENKEYIKGMYGAKLLSDCALKITQCPLTKEKIFQRRK